MPEWMTVEDVCEYLQVSKSTVFRWTNQGKLPAYKFGGARRYKREDVDALAEPIVPEDHDDANPV
jgi:excisionase family DNA binding protein